MDDVFLSPEQVAKRLGLSTYTVRKHARTGVLPAQKVGRIWRFPRSSLESWMAPAYPRADMAEGALIVRDAASQSTASLEQESSPVPGFPPLGDQDDPLGYGARLRKAVDTMLEIRARAKKGDVQAIVRESRVQLEERGLCHDKT